MELKEFFENFAEVMDMDDANSLSENTEFKELEEWSSLSALGLMAMIDEQYGVSLTAADIRGSKTIGDIIEKIKSHSNE